MVSKKFLAATIHHCKWLPCPPGSSVSEDGSLICQDLPAILAGWSEDVKQHVLGVADVQLDTSTGEICDCKYKKALVQGDRVTDLQVARIDDTILAATSNHSGSVSVLFMELPGAVPNATTADLKFLASDREDQEDVGDDALLHVVPGLHSAPAASVDVNSMRKVLLSVSGDGSICLVPLEQLQGHTFKQASGWSGYSQGRWVDSNCFLTTGVLGGMQHWDERKGPSPVSSSPQAWGHTGCGLLDKRDGLQRQLLCLGVHPSRPNLAVTGSSSGTVAVWDLRLSSAPLALTGPRPAAGDVTQCMFDVYNSGGAAGTPGVLFSTLDGALCLAEDATTAAANKTSVQQGSRWPTDSSVASGLSAQVLHREPYAISSFDVEPAFGRHVLACTDDEHVLLLQVDSLQNQV